MVQQALLLDTKKVLAGLWIMLIVFGLLIGIAVVYDARLSILAILTIGFLILGFLFPEHIALLSLISVAISPQYLTSASLFGIELSSIHKLVILAGVSPYILTHGLREAFNPIILGYLLVLMLTFTLSTPPPQLGIMQPFKSLLGLITGWIIFVTNWRSNHAPKYSLLIGLLPVFSVIIGIVLHIAGIRPVIIIEYTGAIRLVGATIAAHLAMLGWIGLAASMGEFLRGQKPFLWLAIVNLAILLGTGTRGATLGALILFIPYGITQLARFLKGRISAQVFLLLVLSSLVLILALPNFLTRISGNQIESTFNTSGRLIAWDFFLDEAKENIWFGRGLGSATVLNQGQTISGFRVPHNEYIRMLVDGGIFGTVILLSAFYLTFRKVYRMTTTGERKYLVAVIFGFMVYSFFDNTLSTTQFSVPFGWLLAIFTLYGRNTQPLDPGSVSQFLVGGEQ